VLPEIQPAKLAKCLAAFDDPDWIFELKHDGFRSLAYLEDGHCRLASRRRNAYKSFEVLRESLSGLKAQSAILDGENRRPPPRKFTAPIAALITSVH
jgi:bifunctional non-homologous end joining protein LigD